jgi:hypothetical protein
MFLAAPPALLSGPIPFQFFHVVPKIKAQGGPMEIKDVRSDMTPTGPVSPIAPVRDDARHVPARPTDRERPRDTDRLDISDRARALAEGDSVSGPEGTLDPERLIDLRRRVQARFYDQPEVAEHVARRILESGDL